MQKLVLILAATLAVFLSGVFTGKAYFGKADKTSTTEIADTKDLNSKTDTDTNKTKSSEEENKSHVTIKRETKLPDGTVISEDIAGDFWNKKIEQENLVMKQHNETLEHENMILKQTVEENTLPSVLVTLFPSYRFGSPMKFDSIEYTLMIQKRVFATCYVGIALNKDYVGVPITCGF